jgi:predicted MFS family arabinose efflux permease
MRTIGLIIALSLAVLSYTLNATMISPLLPEIAGQLRVDSADISLVSSLFFLSGSVAGIVLNRWSDFVGRRRMLVGALATTSLGTLICIVAPNLPLLLCGRVLQGAASAAFQLSYIVLVEMLTRAEFSIALGVITAVNGGFGGIDGYLGGLLARRYGYRSVFICILVVGMIAIFCVQKTLTRQAARATGKMDWRGAAFLSAGLICLMSTLSTGSAAGWLAPSTLLLLVAAILCFWLFWRVESAQEFPLIKVAHFRSRRIWPILATTILTLASVFAVINFTIVLLSQNREIGFGLSPARSALMFLTPPALIGVVAAPLSGWIANRWGWVGTMRTGLGCCVLTLGVIALFPQQQGTVFLGVAALGIFYYGFALTTVNGLGVFLSPAEAPAALPGLNGAAFGIGASLGIGMVAPFVAQGDLAGYSLALWISVAIAVTALATSCFVVQPALETAKA